MKFQNLRGKFVIMFFVIIAVSSVVATSVHMFLNRDGIRRFVDSDQRAAIEIINVLMDSTDMTLVEIAEKIQFDNVYVEVVNSLPENIKVSNKTDEEIQHQNITVLDFGMGKQIKTVIMPIDGRYLLIHKKNSASLLGVLPLVILCVVFATAITFVVSKHALNPILRLSSAMAQVAGGNFKIQLETKSKDEIGMLTDSFNMMTKELDGMKTLRDDFVSNVSHEFKTPVASIRGFAGLLLDSSICEEERFEYVKIIIEEADRLTKLSSNILHLSKLNNGKITVDSISFRIDESIRRYLVMLETEWKKKNIGMNIELEKIYYYGDPEMLSLIWINLIGNAIKFTGNCGEISVKLFTKGDRIVLTVCDNGIGISKSAIPYLFDKFYQEDLSHSTTGNGLGLTIVESVVERCGGEIEVESEKNQGSLFTVRIPMQKNKQFPL